MTQRKSSGDPLRIDIRVAVKRGYDKSPAAQEKAIKHWAKTGSAPEGYRITAIQWQNPERKDPAKRDWRSDTPERAQESLRRYLQAGRFRRA